ncbi:MAG: hypothetical protein ACREH8_03225 [Opitutaceae bacterium]
MAGSSEAPVLSGRAFGCAFLPAGADPERAEASSDADDSGTGEFAGESAGTSLEGSGTAGGAGSLARRALTEVSPVNGFLYSVTGVMTARAVGLYAAGLAAALAEPVAMIGRFPRARPEPRVAPKEPNAAGALAGAGAGVGAWAASAGAGAGADKSAGA